jgi:hypothetical protein
MSPWHKGVTALRLFPPQRERVRSLREATRRVVAYVDLPQKKLRRFAARTEIKTPGPEGTRRQADAYTRLPFITS